MRRDLVWVVDDDLDQQAILKTVLSKKYRVGFYKNGKEAWESLQKIFPEKIKRPSLILLDIMMPEMDGITCLKKIRTLTKKDFIPILMLTAKIGSGDKVEALKAGADDFITKPFNMDELEARVEVMLRIKHQGDRIKKYSERLKKADQLKEEMLAICSHDLQSPLGSLVMVADHLLNSGDEQLGERQKEGIEKMRQKAQRAILLVRDILDLGRLEKGGLKFEKIQFPFDPLVKEGFEAISLQAERHSIRLHYKGEAKKTLAYGDPRWIGQVLQNLLSNAIKFNRVGGEVEIKTKVIEGKRHNDPPQLLLVEVKDTGRGIPEGEIFKLFNKYVQLKKRDTLKGTGLGLAICRKIIDLHHGDIWAKSKVGKGSTFYFTLPAN